MSGRPKKYLTLVEWLKWKDNDWLHLNRKVWFLMGAVTAIIAMLGFILSKV